MMRSGIIDKRVVPVENLATSPGFERIVAGSTITRRNLATYPQGNNQGGGVAGWTMRGSGANTNFARISSANDGPLAIITGYARRTFTGTVSVADAGFDNSQYPAPLPVTIGKVYTYSVWLRTNVTGVRLRLRVQHMPAANTSGSVEYSPSTTSSQSGVWTRLSMTFTATQPYVQLIASSENGGSINSFVAGDTFDGTGLLLEERPGPALPYFDGATTDTSSAVYAWEGAANASTSVVKTAAIEVRRNYAVDPAATTLSASGGPRIANDRWPSEGTYSIVTPSDSPIGTATAIQFLVTTARSSGHGFHLADNPEGSGTPTGNMLPVAAGDYVTVSVYVKKVGTATTMSVRIRGTNGSGWVSQVVSTATAVSGSSWTRLSATYLVPSTVTYVSAYVTGGADAVNDVWQATGLLIEKSSSLGSFFSGDYTPDADLMPLWTGTSNNSVSILNGARIDTVAGLQRGNALAIQSLGWSAHGKASLRIISQATDSNSYAAITYTWLNLLPNRTYTAIATSRLITPLTGTLHSRARGIMARTTVDTVAKGTNNAGIEVVKVSFTMPDTPTTGMGIYLYNGASPGNGDVWWDDLAVIEGVYTGPYLDGDMPGCLWRGGAHNSTSIGYPSNV